MVVFFEKDQRIPNMLRTTLTAINRESTITANPQMTKYVFGTENFFCFLRWSCIGVKVFLRIMTFLCVSLPMVILRMLRPPSRRNGRPIIRYVNGILRIIA